MQTIDLWAPALVEELHQLALALPRGDWLEADGHPVAPVPPDGLDPLIAWLLVPRRRDVRGVLCWRELGSAWRSSPTHPEALGRRLDRMRAAGRAVYAICLPQPPHAPYAITWADARGAVSGREGYLLDPPDHGWMAAELRRPSAARPLASGERPDPGHAIAAGWLRRVGAAAPPPDAQSVDGFLPHPPEPPERPEDFLRVVAVPTGGGGVRVLQSVEPEQLDALRRYAAAQPV